MTERPAQEFRIGQSKSRHGLVIAGICVLVGAGTLLIADQRVSERAWVAALLIALGIATGIRAWRLGHTAGAHLRVDEAGVYFREWGATVPWSEIADVYQSGSRLQPFVTLRVRDPARLLAGLPQDEARKLGRNRLWKPPELRIPYAAVEGTRDEILAAIEGGLEGRNPSIA